MEYCTCVKPTVLQINDDTKCDQCGKSLDDSDLDLQKLHGDNGNELSTQDIIEIIDLSKLTKNTLLKINIPQPFKKTEMRRLKNWLEKEIPKGGTVFIAREGETIEFLSKEQMAKVGWFRGDDEILITDTNGGGVRSEYPAIPAKKALPPTLRDVKEIVKQYLITNGYGGLCTEDCGCEVDDLRPCCEDFSDCEPGYLHPDGTINTRKYDKTAEKKFYNDADV